MKIIVKIPYNEHHWTTRLLSRHNKKRFVGVIKVSTFTFESIEAYMSSYLLSSVWIKEIIEE